MKLKLWHAFAVWLLVSLVAIALVGDNPYLGVAVAVAGGVCFGLLNAMTFAARK